LRVVVAPGRGADSQRVEMLVRPGRRSAPHPVFDGIPDPSYAGGVSLAAADTDLNGLEELVVAEADGNDGNVGAVVFGLFEVVGGVESWAPRYGFPVFSSTDLFAGQPINALGATVAAGNVAGGAKEELLFGPAQGVPIVRVFSSNVCSLNPALPCATDATCSASGVGTCTVPGSGKLFEWLAYTPGTESGVSIAVGDLDNNGTKEVVTIPVSGRAWVKAWTASGSPYVPTGSTSATSFFAFPGDAGAAGIALADVDFDGKDEILVTPTSGSPVEILAFEADGTPVAGWKTVRPFGPIIGRGAAFAATNRFLRHL